MSEISDRLREARRRAGFDTMTEAAEHFGWKLSTYGGHENGSRGIKHPDLGKYAEAFGVTPAWLLTGADRSAPATNRPPGFSEAAIAPFHARTDGERRAILALADHAGRQARSPTLHRCGKHVPALGMLPGDVIVMDARPSPKNGQPVVVQVQNLESGEAETRFAVFHHGRAVPLPGEPGFDGAAVRIMGAVCATVRLT